MALFLKIAAEIAKQQKFIDAGPVAAWLWLAGVGHCRLSSTDGFIPRLVVPTLVPGLSGAKSFKEAERLVMVGLWDKQDKGFTVHDYFDWNPSKAEIEEQTGWDRARKELYRDRDAVDYIKARDGDSCRYCGVPVNWLDRRGDRGGQFEHVIPRGETTIYNIVVACRECNYKKRSRTPEEAGMPLLPPVRPDLPIPVKFQIGTRTGTSSDLDIDRARIRGGAPGASSPSPSGTPSGFGSGSGNSEESARETTALAHVAPIRPARAKPLMGSHLGCFFAPTACARGLCIPAWLGTEWLQQFDDPAEAPREIAAFVADTLARLPDGPVGDEPKAFWRAAWKARYAAKASRAGSRTGDSVDAAREFLTERVAALTAKERD